MIRGHLVASLKLLKCVYFILIDLFFLYKTIVIYCYNFEEIKYYGVLIDIFNILMLLCFLQN